MKVGILYIATGRYITFWKHFYSAMMEHFLPNVEKHFFVFTDCKEPLSAGGGRISTKFTNKTKVGCMRC